MCWLRGDLWHQWACHQIRRCWHHVEHVVWRLRYLASPHRHELWLPRQRRGRLGHILGNFSHPLNFWMRMYLLSDYGSWGLGSTLDYNLLKLPITYEILFEGCRRRALGRQELGLRNESTRPICPLWVVQFLLAIEITRWGLV